MGKIHGFRIKRRRRRVRFSGSGYNRFKRTASSRARSISRIFHSLKQKAMSFCSSKSSNSRRGYFPLAGGGGDYCSTENVAVPKGYMDVYVGKRDDDDGVHQFTIPVMYINHPLFGELLRAAQEEFGFNHPGRITIPCKVSDFENVQTRIAAACARRRKSHKWG